MVEIIQHTMPDVHAQLFLKRVLPEAKQQIADQVVSGSGIHDTAQVLQISPMTVIETLKKNPPA